VYASRSIPTGTVIEISPVLLFSQSEYREHGQYTVLDHYTFRWPDGRMALALGLGSLFNHSESPNVSYHLDTDSESIRYVAARTILADEELFIFYGHKLWFKDVDHASATEVAPEADDGWGGLSVVAGGEEEGHSTWPWLTGNSEDVVPMNDLPFTRLKLMPDDEEEDVLDAIRTVNAWVVDIADSRHIATLLKWIRQADLEEPSLSHLKRIRKSGEYSSLLLAPVSLYPEPPSLPNAISLPPPYIVAVPRSVALTQISLKLKTSFWPTVYAPRKKWEPESWTKGKVRWAWEAMRTVLKEAEEAREHGELPIVAYVPPAYDTDAQDLARLQEPIIAHDTRRSLSHPLRHAVLNVVRAVADHRATSGSKDEAPLDVPTDVTSRDSMVESGASRNGSHYLLTSLTLFASHEPCIMCSMALLHSRVKDVFYLVPMEKTGGCGGLACVPKLDGVNHRFGIGKWVDGEGGISGSAVAIEDITDA